MCEREGERENVLKTLSTRGCICMERMLTFSVLLWVRYYDGVWNVVDPKLRMQLTKTEAQVHTHRTFNNESLPFTKRVKQKKQDKNTHRTFNNESLPFTKRG